MSPGWNEAVPPNGFHNRAEVDSPESNDNPLGLASPVGEVDIETTPEHRNLVTGDPRCVGWTRCYDDPNVVALPLSQTVLPPDVTCLLLSPASSGPGCGFARHTRRVCTLKRRQQIGVS